MPQFRRSAAAAFVAAAIGLVAAASAAAAPPSAPRQVRVTNVTDTAIVLAWNAPRPRTNVAGYALYLDGTAVGTTTTRTHVFDGLQCGTTHAVGVATVAGDGSRSVVRTRTRQTDRCPAGPTVTLSTTPPALTNSPNATFGFSSPTGRSFACSLDGSPFAVCTSPRSYAGLTDGAHTFRVVARRGAQSGPAASYAWTVDTVAPAVSLTNTPSALTTSRNAALSFASPDSTATFACSLDGAAFAVCTSPAGYVALADGAHTFQVRATDLAGNTGAPAAAGWTIDTVSPTVTLLTTPPSLTNDSGASFTFATSDATAVLQCSYDGAAFAACTSPANYAAVADGPHTFQVRAVDPAGNVGTPAAFTWRVDTLAPAVSLTSTPDAVDASSDAAFSFSSADAAATFQCSLDGAAFAACATPAAYTGLGDGAHTFQVRATDPAGNTGAPAAFAWTIDTGASGPSAPTVTIGDTPPLMSALPDATFTFSSGDAAATFECSLDDSPFAACTSPAAYEGLADGTHTFQVRAVRAGLTGPAASYTWQIDTGFGF